MSVDAVTVLLESVRVYGGCAGGDGGSVTDDDEPVRARALRLRARVAFLTRFVVFASAAAPFVSQFGDSVPKFVTSVAAAIDSVGMSIESVKPLLDIARRYAHTVVWFVVVAAWHDAVVSVSLDVV